MPFSKARFHSPPTKAQMAKAKKTKARIKGAIKKVKRIIKRK